jgi:Domain of unknown function (DUF5069)
MSAAKNLSKEPPRSPAVRLRDYAILARTLDKCRAHLAGTIGEYHYNCPLDNMLFGFKKIDSEDFKTCVENAEHDDDVALWLDQSGVHKTQHEIQEWSDERAAFNPCDEPEMKDWFVGECQKLGLDPVKTTLFQFLSADDDASFKK